jgi:hypothetical protein
MVQGQFTHGGEREYRERHKEEKKIHKRKKREYQELELLHTANECRTFFRRVSSIQGEYQPRVTVCRNNEGEIVSDKDEILSRWKEYFEECLGEEILETENRTEDSAETRLDRTQE